MFPATDNTRGLNEEPRYLVSGGRPPDQPVDDEHMGFDEPPDMHEEHATHREDQMFSAEQYTRELNEDPRYIMSGGRPPDQPPHPGLDEQAPKRQRISLVLDGTTLDPSNSYGLYRGIYWCCNCSGIAKSRPLRLALPCVAVGKPLRQDGNINQLKNKKATHQDASFWVARP